MMISIFRKREINGGPHESAWIVFRNLILTHGIQAAEQFLHSLSRENRVVRLRDKQISIDEFDPISLDFRGSCFYVCMPKLRGTFLDGQCHRFFALIPLLLACFKSGFEGRMELCVQDHDNTDAVSFCSNRRGSRLIPDHEYIISRGHKSFRRTLSNQQLRWPYRRPVAVWRGSTTGEQCLNNWKEMARLRLCRKAADNPLFDVAISNVVQIPDHLEAISYLQESRLIKGPLSPLEVANCKFQIDIDGNSNAWSGLYTKLLSGSPVVKVQSEKGYKQWYYSKLQQNVNYIEILPDLSDLYDKVRWLADHDKEAEKIGAAGKALALSLDYKSEMASAIKTMKAALF